MKTRREITFGYRKCLRYLAFLSLLTVVQAPTCGAQDLQRADAEIEGRLVRKRDDASPDGQWQTQIVYDRVIEGLAEPSDDLEQLHVCVDSVSLNRLGNQVNASGRVLKEMAGSKELEPYRFRMPITVAIETTPADKQNGEAAFSLLSTDSIHGTARTRVDGSFEVVLGYEWKDFKVLHGEESYRFAVFLGLSHQGDAATATKGTVLTWTSNDELLPSSLQVVEMPANNPLDEVQIKLHAACRDTTDTYGLKAIRAINALQPLGKERALAKISDYQASAKAGDFRSNPMAITWIMKLLFEPSDLGDAAEFSRIAQRIFEPEVQAHWPGDPWLVISDIPLRYPEAVGMSSGQPPKFGEHFEFFERRCVLRYRKLHPAQDPVLFLKELEDSAPIGSIPRGEWDNPLGDLRAQVFNLIPESRRKKIGLGEDAWESACRLSQESPLKWNRDLERFEEE
ncbi:MAG: hypothetical protein AAF483_07180 [Planctomycetota bacterium]